MSPERLEAEVRRVARLSRLNLSESEVREFAPQLGRILDYVRQVEQIDTTGVAPLAHPVPLRDVVRDDVPHEPLSPDQALANAPEREGEFFKVPAVLDPGAGA
ncbi:Glutamyl-tRNA(Gln) amidotransferase subunit C [Phycisphaerae bacterium RAS1]|nr:Glutamyl-tRNA(Gln) amidotransferase subunit C [Phycisphaerae bacterium RAS1]